MINNFDIRTDIREVRNSLGLCPQHDVLFDELTVEEHLRFFCLVKLTNELVIVLPNLTFAYLTFSVSQSWRVKSKEKVNLIQFLQMKGYPNAESEINRMLGALNLEPKRNAMSKELSGGMKRRLSVSFLTEVNIS